MIAVLILGVESRKPTIDVGVFPDDLVEETHAVAPRIARLVREIFPQLLLTTDELVSGEGPVANDAQYVQLPANLALESLQPFQDAGNGFNGSLLQQDRYQHEVGGCKGVDASGRQSRRAVDQHDVVVVAQFGRMKCLAEAIPDVVAGDAAVPAHHELVLDVRERLVNGRQVKLAVADGRVREG